MNRGEDGQETRARVIEAGKVKKKKTWKWREAEEQSRPLLCSETRTAISAISAISVLIYGAVTGR
jgi:hypothetical protein